MILLREGKEVITALVSLHMIDNPSESNGHTTHVRMRTAYYPWSWEENVSKSCHL